jgi:hypothetical protein
MPIIAKQISVFVENKPSRIALITKTLRLCGVNVSAFMVADAGEFGVIHLLVDDHTKGRHCLEEAGFTTTETDVIEIREESQDLAVEQAVTHLGAAGINVRYAYGSLLNGGSMILKTSDTGRALEILERLF